VSKAELLAVVFLPCERLKAQMR